MYPFFPSQHGGAGSCDSPEAGATHLGGANCAAGREPEEKMMNGSGGEGEGGANLERERISRGLGANSEETLGWCCCQLADNWNRVRFVPATAASADDDDVEEEAGEKSPT